MFRFSLIKALVGVCLVSLAAMSAAATAEDGRELVNKVRERLAAPAEQGDNPGQDPRLTLSLRDMLGDVEKVKASTVPGLYEVRTSGGQIFYLSEDGEHLIFGSLLQARSGVAVNLTENAQNEVRAGTMEAFGDEGAISYPAKGKQKAEIAVFTDIDCPYCRKFHEQVPRINELGITVNYYGFPRSGPDTDSFYKYESVWCNADPQAAMNRAKAGQQVPQKACDNPVLEQMQLGQQVGVRGTPAIVLENGRMIPGFVPAETLAKTLGLL
ncbi:MAG: DsbC family protein [Pseudomonadota bacterium]|nr:DsbC family protein [Pseudomonadota bacterium]